VADGTSTRINADRTNTSSQTFRNQAGPDRCHVWIRRRQVPVPAFDGERFSVLCENPAAGPV